MVTLLGPLIDSTENVTSVPIATGLDPNSFRVVYSVYAPNLNPNSVVMVVTQFEITGGYSYTPGVGRFIQRTDTPTGTTTGSNVTKPVVSNFITAENHFVVTMLGIDSGMAAGNYYYNVVVYAFSNHAKPGDQFVVEQHYGDCSVLIFDRP